MTKYPNIFWGKVIGGEHRGKSFGFPTANVKLHRKITEGIYISLAKVNRKSLPALTFVGNATTFGEKTVRAETYFLTLSADLYGKWISVRLLKKIRENQKFKSAEDLILQMEKDKLRAQRYFKNV